MKQVLIIHGGNSFSSYESYLDDLKNSQISYERLLYQKKWKPWVAKKLTDHEVLLPNFPNSQNANFDEWSIYFEKIIPLLRPGYQLVGHSLGAMFLAKYLDSHQLPIKAKRLILVSAGYASETKEDYESFKITSAKNIVSSAEEIHLLHSEDDLVVPFTEMASYQNDIPDAKSHVFTDRGHFNDQDFPELLELLQQK